MLLTTINLAGGFRITWDEMAVDWKPVTEDYALPDTFKVVHAGTEGEPRLSVTFQIRDGVPTCTSVELAAKRSGREVRNSDLRGVPSIDQMAEVAIEVLAGDVQHDANGNITRIDLWAETSSARQRFARLVRKQAPRRRAVDLAEVARVYESHLQDAPTLAVAEHFGVTRSTASQYASRARDAGYLTATSPGGRPRTREEKT
jgi:hypothetical protein